MNPGTTDSTRPPRSGVVELADLSPAMRRTAGRLIAAVGKGEGRLFLNGVAPLSIYMRCPVPTHVSRPDEDDPDPTDLEININTAGGVIDYICLEHCLELDVYRAVKARLNGGDAA